MNIETKIKVKQIVGWRDIDGRIVIFNPQKQSLAMLNETASFLWKNISQWIDFVTLSKKLAKEYRIPYALARRDTTDLLRELSILDFLEILGNREQRLESKYQGDTIDDDLLLRLEKLAIQKMIPFSATFELTYRCNEDCIHCSIIKKKSSELTTQEVKDILIDLASEGCIFISFTGGEIFARPDLLEILSFASEQRFVIDLLTNGTLIDDGIADFLERQIIRRVQISLYASKPEIHDAITRREGSFKRTLEAIGLLLKRGVKVEIAFPIMKINFEERRAVRDLVESLGAQFLPSHIITPRNDGSRDVFDLRIDDIQLQQLLSEDIFTYYSGRKPFQEHQFYMGFINLQEANPCYSGINSCAITPIGEVLPCNQLLYRLGSLRKNSFAEIWHNSEALRKLRSIKIKHLNTCSKCQMLAYCSRCPGLALLENGDLLGMSSENCRITRIWVKNLERR